MTPKRFAAGATLERGARDQVAREAEAAFDFQPSLYFFAGVAHPSITTAQGQRLSGNDFRRLSSQGYLTAVTVPLDGDDDSGVVAYRHDRFKFKGICLSDSVVWTTCLQGTACYLRRTDATSMFERYAKCAYISAGASLAGRLLGEAQVFARRGLMVAPSLRRSPIAAQLYGVLLAAATRGAKQESVRREIGLMLEPAQVRIAIETAAAALASHQPQTCDLRRTDRAVAVGIPVAPRKVA